jgi:hypothetical protein
MVGVELTMFIFCVVINHNLAEHLAGGTVTIAVASTL